MTTSSSSNMVARRFRRAYRIQPNVRISGLPVPESEKDRQALLLPLPLGVTGNVR